MQLQLLVTILFVAATAEPMWPITCKVFTLWPCVDKDSSPRLLEERQISLSLTVSHCPYPMRDVFVKTGHHVVTIVPGSLAPSGESGDAKALQESVLIELHRPTWCLRHLVPGPLQKCSK